MVTSMSLYSELLILRCKVSIQLFTLVEITINSTPTRVLSLNICFLNFNKWSKQERENYTSITSVVRIFRPIFILTICDNTYNDIGKVCQEKEGGFFLLKWPGRITLGTMVLPQATNGKDIVL